MAVFNQMRHSLSDSMDFLINALKWPFAVASLFLFPSCLLVCWPCFAQLFRSSSMLPFAIGIIVFWMVNKLLKTTTLWTWLWVLEHETVHLLMGLLCLKVPTRWRVSGAGGHVGFDRGDNWLITIAPYVFPLIPLGTFCLLRIISVFIPLNFYVLPAVMGFSVAAHVAFTWLESDYHQPDIQRVGGLFALLVVPTLHLLFVAAILVLTTSASPSAVRPLVKLFQDITENGYRSWECVISCGHRLIHAVQSSNGSQNLERFEFDLGERNIPAEHFETPISSGVRFDRKGGTMRSSEMSAVDSLGL